MLLFTLVEAYLMIGGGVILLGFGGNRFTAAASEGYFPFVIRVGVRLLFYYLVLAVGDATRRPSGTRRCVAACKPVTTALPLVLTYYVPPSKIMTTVCSGSLSAADMLNYTIGVARLRDHRPSAFRIPSRVWSAARSALHSRTPSRRPTSHRPSSVPSQAGLRKIPMESPASQRAMEHAAAAACRPPCKTILAQHQRQTSADQAANAATKVLNPFNGQPPGYNYRPPNGASPSPSGPALPPPPNNGPGSGGAALEYQPGRPGQYTRDMAVDVTELQNGNGKDVS